MSWPNRFKLRPHTTSQLGVLRRAAMAALLAVTPFSLVSAQVTALTEVPKRDTDENWPPREYLPLGPAAWEKVPAKAIPPEFDEITVYGVTDTPDPMAHRLTYTPLEQVDGDALPLVYRAIVAIGGERGYQTQPDVLKVFGTDEAWTDEMLVRRQAEVRAAVDDGAWSELKLAVRRTRCLWDFALDERQDADLVAVLLPDIQSMRNFARRGSLKFRLEYLTGDFEAARETLRVTLALAKMTNGNGDSQSFLIKDLVAIAMASTTLGDVQTWIGLPDAPSLYWELAALPRPLIDLRPTVNDELWLSFRIFKSLRDVPREPDPSRDWDRTLSESYGTLNQLGPMTTGRTEALVPLLVTIMAEPKVAAILKSDGFTDEQIAAFPTGQRILLAERIWLLRFIGTQERAINLSYPESVAMLGSSLDGKTFGEEMANEPLPVGQLLIPALMASLRAQVRLEQTVVRLRIVEALRLHAGQTGKLPQSLDEITIVPVPNDPATDAPVGYEVLDDGSVMIRVQQLAGYPKPLKVTLGTR